MFPSNGNDPFSYSDQPFDFESNQTSKQETIICDHLPYNSPPNLSFYHFPSPFDDYQIFHDRQQPHDFLLESLAEPPEPQPVEEKEVSIKTKVPRKRAGKRDRHSKINTARGLRDRRMRLSLQVAKRFFRLQDMLGFEKASKTVEWLLNQAKEEINQLAAECEGLSSPEEVVLNENNQQQKKKPQGVKRRTMHFRKFSAFHPLARECRERARERARERTKEKMKSKQCEESTNHRLTQFGSCQSLNPSLDLVTNARELSCLSEEHLGTVEGIAHEDTYGYYEQKEQTHHGFQFS